MLVAGNATMVNMIALVSCCRAKSPYIFFSLIIQGIVTLFQNPSQLYDLKSDTGLVPAFVEELCRYHTASAMATRRVAKVDIMLGDKVRFPQNFNLGSVLLIVRKAY